MTGRDLLAESLRLHLRETADELPAQGQLETVLSRTATIRPRPRWLATMQTGKNGVRTRATASPAVRVAVVAVLIALLTVLAVVLVTGQRPRSGGLLGFSRDGVIYLTQPDGKGTIQAAELPDYGLAVWSDPRMWSPDGRYLIVHGSRIVPPDSGTEPPSEVFVLDSGTLDLREIGLGSFLGWTPDGLALLTSSDGTLVTYAIGERTLQVIGQSETRVPVGAQLSPDGRWLIAMEGQFLARIDAQTGETKLIYDNGGELADLPAWSPDSSRISFARTHSPLCHTCMGPILVVSVDGASVTTVSRPESFAVRSKWSPSGEWLAYITDATGAGIEQSSLEIVRPDGTGRRTLSTTWPTDFAWSPDGTRIRYQTDALDEAQSRYTLVEMDLRTGVTKRVDDGAGVEGFAWQPLPPGSSFPLLQP